MQFYRDGFHAGDPRVAPRHPMSTSTSQDGEVDIDVLVVGTGPAGLVLGAQLARFPMIRTHVIERRDGPMHLGQADGVACRTVEMLEAFGLAGRLLEEAYWVNETTFWRPDPASPTAIIRTGRVQDVEDGLSEMPHVIMNQARIHDYLLGAMRDAPTRLEADYGLELVDLHVPETGAPVSATMRNVATGETKVTRARYVVGCDGAQSLVREAIGRQLIGDRANHAWGVMDVLAVTDFPDIRFKSAIQSSEGSILLIPREGGYLARLYVDLGTVTEENRARIRAMNAEDVVSVAERVLKPYSFEVRETVWFSVYEVAQRIADGFDDTVDDARGRANPPRVFIAGDACHTHSAKAGQGMNVSMQDAFNLGWKLAAVLEGRSGTSLLETYDEERRPVAQQLIDFDREWSAMLASPPADPDHPDRGGLTPQALSEYFVRQGRYTAGIATEYPASRLVGNDKHQDIAPGFRVGSRFHSGPVTRLCDSKRVELSHAAKADGRWRLYAFADADMRDWGVTLDWLAIDPESPVVRHSPAGVSIDSLIDIRGVLQGPAHETEVGELPELLRPITGKLGLVDLEKAFAATTSPHSAREQDIFNDRQINRGTGALVVVRPDQYVAQVLPLDATAKLAQFFGEVFTQ